jgi:hypothetical protein
MDQLTYTVLIALSAGTTLTTVTGRLGDWEIVGGALGIVLWGLVSQHSFAVQVYSGGVLVDTQTFVSLAIVAGALAIVHLVVSIETASFMLRNRGVFFDG